MTRIRPGQRVAMTASAPLVLDTKMIALEGTRSARKFVGTRGTVIERHAVHTHLWWVRFDGYSTLKLCTVEDQMGPGNIRPLDTLEALSEV